MKKLIITSIATLTLGAFLHAEEAKVNWDKNCAACHGKEGKGDTKMGQKLEARDFTDPKVQAALKDEEMSKAIKEGLKKDGKTQMKAFGDKLSDEEIKALVAHIRGLKK
jgi:mono/diheme cytochrome c family protein